MFQYFNLEYLLVLAQYSAVQSLLNIPLKWLDFYLTAEFHGIWESLVYESGLKTQVKKYGSWEMRENDYITFSLLNAKLHIVLISLQLLDYVTTTIYFSDKNVDSNLISWNRVVLLHGK